MLLLEDFEATEQEMALDRKADGAGTPGGHRPRGTPQFNGRLAIGGRKPDMNDARIIEARRRCSVSECGEHVVIERLHFAPPEFDA
jgi:hypothetical protein